ncbi:MAG: transposase [Polaromonas sp.]|nr:transposase [Polaromonas sp.]
MINSRTVVQGQDIVAKELSWIDRELHEGAFQDARLLQRLRVLLGQFAQAPGQSISLVCQDWANTKAAYRFLSNARVSEADILAGHFDAPRQRIAATHEAPVLMLHDTTEFSWQREIAQAVGVLGKTNSGRDAERRVRQHTVCGLLMHSSLAVTREGLPLGLAAMVRTGSPVGACRCRSPQPGNPTHQGASKHAKSSLTHITSGDNFLDSHWKRVSARQLLRLYPMTNAWAIWPRFGPARRAATCAFRQEPGAFAIAAGFVATPRCALERRIPPHR